jgi:PqqD family protein of HPr-rel-A system
MLAPADLAWRCWDGEYIVFHPFSGMTHYLDATAGVVFELLLERPATVRDLTIELESLTEMPASDVICAAVQQVLRRFEDVGLAEPMP